MANVIKQIPNPNSQLQFYFFNCPGCDGFHLFDSTWQFNGNFKQPTVKPSILTRGALYDKDGNPSGKYTDRCHLFITNGQIKYLRDCAHNMKDQQVPMVEIQTT